MRRRITLFHKQENAIQPDAVQVSETAISGPDIIAVREDRLTVAIDELPDELSQLLRSSQELHIRWTRFDVGESVYPLFSRLPPGLHVFYTPPADRTDALGQLCPALQQAFGQLECDSAEEAFTKLPRDQFAHSTSFQYYQPVAYPLTFVQYVTSTICAPGDSQCVSHAKALSDVQSLDISYDNISEKLKINAVWPHQKQPILVSALDGHYTEVGILTKDTLPNLEPHQQGVAALLTVLGQDKKPKSHNFAVPLQHQRADGTFSSTFLTPTGLHPTLQLKLISTKPPAIGDDCRIYAYLTLPRTVFVDKYQLADSLFMMSKNLSKLEYISQPVDLEAPDYVTNIWGSSVLLELAPPTEDGLWTAEIPLHLRYLLPAKGGYRDIEVPYPTVFWACEMPEDTRFKGPFERAKLGYDGLFRETTIFHHVDPMPEVTANLANQITVPVLDLDKSDWVNAGTAATILLGFGWVLFKLMQAYSSSGYKVVPTKEGKERKDQ